jgi:hypothetical protein
MDYLRLGETILSPARSPGYLSEVVAAITFGGGEQPKETYL